jgi:eukaryotic-like serine/threonine-protein kinase
MKRCPECRRDYYDETLLYCLEDGTALVQGSVPPPDEAQTAILHETAPPNEAATRAQIHSTNADGPDQTIAVEKKPNGRPFVRRTLLVLASVAVLIVVGLLAYMYLGSDGQQIDSVAVLPFENVSDDPGLGYLSDGLSESLIDKLSELPQIKVIARNSSFKYRGTSLDLQEVANKLGVRAIVTGKVTKIGDNLNVRVEMVDASENRQMWSEQYNRRMSDLVLIQQEIAQTASDKLRLKLSGAQEQQLAKRGTLNPQAYELLLRGRYYRSKPGTDSVKRSIDFFEQAVAIDPDYALAHAELSLKYYVLTGGSAADPKVYMPKAESAARKALSLDENLAEAHLAISRIYVAKWQWHDGEAERKRAIELDPNNALAHDLYAQLLAILARFDESIEQARRAKELDPLSVITVSDLGFRLYFARRYDESIEASKKALELDPNSDQVYNFLGYAYAGKGQYKEAIDAYQKAIRLGDESTGIQVFLGAAYAGAGTREKAEAILKKLQSTSDYVSPAELAVLYTALNNKDAAIASLNRAYEEHDLQMQFLKVEQSYDSLRDDPRFQDLMKKVGLPD